MIADPPPDTPTKISYAEVLKEAAELVELKWPVSRQKQYARPARRADLWTKIPASA